MKKVIVLTGNDLTIQDIDGLSHDLHITVGIAPSALRAVEQSKKFLDKECREKIIYGVNTGFGPMASHILGKSELLELQKNLIRSHAVGMGNPLPIKYVLAAMVVRLNTLTKGHSGVSPRILHQLETFINQRIIPVVPEHGAVGTSGDLVQLAHIALALIGEGEVFYRGKRVPTAKVLKELDISPCELGPKEGLALINGTSMMSAINALLCVQAKQLVGLSVRFGALSLELTSGFRDSICENLHALRPHSGQQEIAKTLRKLLASSALMQDRKDFQKQFGLTEDLHVISEHVQEVYSLRCIPQIVGPVFDILQKVWREVSIEVNSVTDNPIIDLKNQAFLHGGNFHGDYMAAAIDQLKASLVKLTMLSERRTNFFLHDKINGIFPPFMNLKRPGLTLGLQGLQFVATSTTAQSQTLAFPQHVHSIPTNADNQDIVSMGTDAALLAARVVENAYIVFTVEALTLAQGVVFSRAKKKLSQDSKKLVDAIHKAVPPIEEDRTFATELPRLTDTLKHYEQIF